MTDQRVDSDLEWAYAVCWSDLPLCGCGYPDDLRDLWRDLLRGIKANVWPTEIVDHEMFRYALLCSLDRAELTEHGMSTDGSWLTDKGRRFLAIVEASTWAQIDEAG